MAQVTMITTGQLATLHSPAAHKKGNNIKKGYNKKTGVDSSARKTKEIKMMRKHRVKNYFEH